MNDPAVLAFRAKLEALNTEQRAINDAAGPSDLNPEQQKRWDEIDAERSETQRELTAREEAIARADRVAESRARFGSFQVGGFTPNYGSSEVARLGVGEARDAALRALDRGGKRLASHQGDHVTALLRSTADENIDADYLARRTVITSSPEYRSAFAQLVTSPHAVLSAPEAHAIRSLQELETRAMAIGASTSGGYGVPVLIDPTIVLTGQQSANPFLAISRVETITTDKWKGVSSAGVTWSWDAEATEVSDDSPTLAQPEVQTHMSRGFVPFSIEVGSDYPRLEDELYGLLAEGYAELTAEAFAVGDGSGKPRGIFHKLDANTNVEVVVTTDGAFGKADISKVWTALPDRAKVNATWLMSEDVKEEIRSFAGDDFAGRTVDLTGADFRIRERAVAASGYAPAFTGSTGAANILVVGDFRKYVIAQRAGMSIELVPHLFGTTNNRPTGQRGLFAWARVGANTIDDTAFRLLQNQ
ncbi:phage major capsid protein [Microbacterium sp. NPDC064584]|uniref:phage major capsid protein n=1 Tax=Microbacterium sp. NPDC064584 TaxID=3155817 RepID=UPI003442E6E9